MLHMVSLSVVSVLSILFVLYVKIEVQIVT